MAVAGRRRLRRSSDRDTGPTGVLKDPKEPPMRVLLAIDGSPSSDAARDLLTSLAWPEGTAVRVVGVVDVTSPALIGYSPYVVPYIDTGALERSLRATVAEMVDSLHVAGLAADKVVLRGRPGSRIVEQAAEFGADLIVLGSRGMGRIQSMLLGSVSAEVVDHAPCPVLVARSDTVERILLATDGSVTADLAVKHVATTGYLGHLPVEVISVARSVPAAAPITEPELTDQSLRHFNEELDEARKHAEATAAAAAEQLVAEGRAIRWSISVGDAAHEIIEAASSLHCDLVVMGSRGLTGLRRILLGSVARNVLLHTDASVLIVREPVRPRTGERSKADVAGIARADPGVTIRPIDPGDDGALQDFYESLSEDSRRKRFMGWNAGLRPGQARTFCTTDHEHREGFVAVLRRPGRDEIVGHLCLEPDGEGSAELAVAVADRVQRQGIGRRLVTAALEWGWRTGTRRFTATAACSNAGIFRLLRSLSIPVQTSSGGAGICDIEIDLEGARSVAV
jgi:nucleotide-binding universal stress UspA family protein/RimJ/RimL family protein N-acetyltransferase